jgi:hypothetical protein
VDGSRLFSQLRNPETAICIIIAFISCCGVSSITPTSKAIVFHRLQSAISGSDYAAVLPTNIVRLLFFSKYMETMVNHCLDTSRLHNILDMASGKGCTELLLIGLFSFN